MATRWLLLAILTASYGAGAFGVLGISPLSPSLVTGFGLTRLELALIVPSIYLAGLLFSLPGGRLADRLGARPSLLGGLLIGAAGLRWNSYAAPWAAFAALSALAAAANLIIGPAIERARR